MLKLCRLTKVKVIFLVLVYVFYFDLFEFLAAIWRRVYSITKYVQETLLKKKKVLNLRKVLNFVKKKKTKYVPHTLLTTLTTHLRQVLYFTNRPFLYDRLLAKSIIIICYCKLYKIYYIFFTFLTNPTT